MADRDVLLGHPYAKWMLNYLVNAPSKIERHVSASCHVAALGDNFDNPDEPQPKNILPTIKTVSLSSALQLPTYHHFSRTQCHVDLG